MFERISKVCMQFAGWALLVFLACCVIIGTNEEWNRRGLTLLDVQGGAMWAATLGVLAGIVTISIHVYRQGR